MAELAESLCTLRSRRNALAYISSLPSELLATIFTYILEEQVFNRCRGVPRPGAPTCEIVMHVCRHWRQVALACPTLWAFIDHAPARRLTIMLERSKTAAFGMFDRIFGLLIIAARPLLETFKLYVLERPGIVRPISDAIFQGRAPQLRSVELIQCTFSWTSNKQVPLCRSSCQFLDEWPGLEQLMLEALSTSSGGRQRVFDQIPLTRLKSIALNSSTVQSTISLFSHLALPVDVKITLDLTQLESPQSFYDLSSAMYKNHDESGPVIRSLSISLMNKSFGVQLSTSMAFKCEQMWNPHDDDTRLSLRFHCDTFIIQPAIIFDMCRMVPHRYIQRLLVSSFLNLPADFWRTGGGPQSSDIAYPSLHALELMYVNFGCNQPKALRDIVTMRARRGVGIRKLRLVDCWNLMDGGVQLLKAVTDVDWDEHQAAWEPFVRT
ncbi:hypothetical protein DFH29DRAFT_970941 [Suillus ampliporus]|nr:hypothetical protein DFH29DRAFT_970941 [Suillus ampliporus]